MKLSTLLKIRKNIFKLIFNIDKLFFTQNEILLKSKEIEWAHIYHDSIRGREWIEKLPMNYGRWAGNYSFFYVLNRVLFDYRPKKILELGLGESSKFISTYVENYLFESYHHIVEHDREWVQSFEQRFNLSEKSKIINCSMIINEINGFNSNYYAEFEDKVVEKYDLYIVDGPFGSQRYSRYNIISLVKRFDSDEEFIIMMDDTNRIGERDTLNDIISILNDKEIVFYIGDYSGCKNVTVISTNKYKYSSSF